MTTDALEPDWEGFYKDYRKPGYIPGYEILNKLGGGAFGVVFKARKESIGKDYAVKFLKLDESAVRGAVMRELEGVSLFAQIDHPNLVTIEDRGEVHGIPFIMMGYAGDDTLRSRIEQGRMPRDTALRITAQVARGLQALHDHSLVHFDLKPANVFLRGDVARLGDYGLSKLVTASHNSLSFGRGTPYYMAPEMLHQRGDHRSDIYSLGVILFEALSGEVPFQGESEWEILRKHEQESPQFPAVIESRERRVIARCLQKDPDARYQSVQAFMDELFAGGAPLAADLASGDAPVPQAAARPAPEPPPIPQGHRPNPPRAPQPRRPTRAQIRRGHGVLKALFLTGAFLLLFVSVLHLTKSDGRDSRPFVTSAFETTPPPARLTFEGQPRPRGTAQTQRILDDLRQGRIQPSVASDVLESRYDPAVVLVTGVNILLDLDYARRDDSLWAKKILDTLAPIANCRFKFYAPPRRGAISRSTARRNRQEIEKFRRHVKRQLSR